MNVLALALHEVSHNRYVYKDFATLISDCVSELIVIITGIWIAKDASYLHTHG